MQPLNLVLAPSTLIDLERAVRDQRRRRAQDALRRLAHASLVPGVPIAGGRMLRAALDG
jgi:hypothetical protein